MSRYDPDYVRPIPRPRGCCRCGVKNYVGGTAAFCRPCVAAYQRNRLGKLSRADRAEYWKARRRKKDPAKERARILLREAVRAGRILKPEYCQTCGGAGRLQGHHDDYSRPYAVDWLCSGCHGTRHCLRLLSDAGAGK